MSGKQLTPLEIARAVTFLQQLKKGGWAADKATIWIKESGDMQVTVAVEGVTITFAGAVDGLVVTEYRISNLALPQGGNLYGELLPDWARTRSPSLTMEFVNKLDGLKS